MRNGRSAGSAAVRGSAARGSRMSVPLPGQRAFVPPDDDSDLVEEILNQEGLSHLHPVEPVTDPEAEEDALFEEVMGDALGGDDALGGGLADILPLGKKGKEHLEWKREQEKKEAAAKETEDAKKSKREAEDSGRSSTSAAHQAELDELEYKIKKAKLLAEAEQAGVKLGAAPVAEEDRLPIFEPLHNVREAAKQLWLLEDHLSQPEKYCPDCIRKHLLGAEALAEEAITLDKDGRYRAILKGLPARIRDLSKGFVAKQDRQDLAQRCRVVRKELSKLGFDTMSRAPSPSAAPPKAAEASTASANVTKHLEHVEALIAEIEKTGKVPLGLRTGAALSLLSAVTAVSRIGKPTAWASPDRWLEYLERVRDRLSDRESEPVRSDRLGLNAALTQARQTFGAVPGLLGIGLGDDRLVFYVKSPRVAGQLPDGFLGWPTKKMLRSTLGASLGAMESVSTPSASPYTRGLVGRSPVIYGVPTSGGGMAWSSGKVVPVGQTVTVNGRSVTVNAQPDPQGQWAILDDQDGTTIWASSERIVRAPLWPVSAELRGKTISRFRSTTGPAFTSYRLSEDQLRMADLIQSMFETTLPSICQDFDLGFEVNPGIKAITCQQILPEKIARGAIVNAIYESNLHPEIASPTEDSVGLWQMNIHGAGAGMTTAERQDPIGSTAKMLAEWKRRAIDDDAARWRALFSMDMAARAAQSPNGGAPIAAYAKAWSDDAERPADPDAGAYRARTAELLWPRSGEMTRTLPSSIPARLQPLATTATTAATTAASTAVSVAPDVERGAEDAGMGAGVVAAVAGLAALAGGAVWWMMGEETP